MHSLIGFYCFRKSLSTMFNLHNITFDLVQTFNQINVYDDRHDSDNPNKVRGYPPSYESEVMFHFEVPF